MSSRPHLARLDDGDVGLQEGGRLLGLLVDELLLALELQQLAVVVRIVVLLHADLSDDLAPSPSSRQQQCSGDSLGNSWSNQDIEQRQAQPLLTCPGYYPNQKGLAAGTQGCAGRANQTLLGRELMVSLRESKGASSLGDSSGCVTVNALDSSSSELGNALQHYSRIQIPFSAV